MSALEVDGFLLEYAQVTDTILDSNPDILRCPTFTVQRMLYLQRLTNILDQDYIANLSDNDIVQLFLHGDLGAVHNYHHFHL